jgi:RimJ/RimL family protein N-acetyltransferase
MIFRHPQLALRAVSDADLAFLQRLYASVREEELRPTGWPEEQKAAFLAMQFQAQHRAYAAYADTDYFIVQRGQQDIGRLYLQHQPETISIVDISLMADTRGQGIGTDLLQAVLPRRGQRTKRCRFMSKNLIRRYACISGWALWRSKIKACIC